VTPGSHPTVCVSAPGKLMLLGEHAVVFGRPCLVTAVDARLHMTLTLLDEPVYEIDAPDVGVQGARGRVAEALRDGAALARGTRFIESSLAVFRDRFGLTNGVHIQTHSDFASTLGLGSSSATVACALVGLVELQGIRVEPAILFELGLEAITRVQKAGSGFDLAAAIFGGTLWYRSTPQREIVPLEPPPLPLVVAYSGVKADTPTLVQGVAGRLARDPSIVNGLFDLMAAVVTAGRPALAAGDWPRLGELMDTQHGLLHALGVDSPRLAALVCAAREAGAYGAKLSGAGGGDCIIALAPEGDRDSVEAVLRAAGGQIVPAAAHAPGVRVEAAS
jgi:mevalonate kinase